MTAKRGHRLLDKVSGYSNCARIVPVRLQATAPAAPASAAEGAWQTVTNPIVGGPRSFEARLRSCQGDSAGMRGASNAGGVATAGGEQGKITKTRKAFEAVTLQVLVGSMLPKENNKSLGTGAAGRMWKTLFAEKLAEKIAASGRVKLLPEAAFAAAAKSGNALAQFAGALPKQSADVNRIEPLMPWTATVVAPRSAGVHEWTTIIEAAMNKGE